MEGGMKNIYILGGDLGGETWLLWCHHYNMTAWILAGNGINFSIAAGLIILECHLGVLNFLCIVQYSSWCNHVMWLIGNSLPCCHGDQVVTGVPLHVTVATWWPRQSGTQPTRIQTCNSRAWICIWFHNITTIWILQLCCVKSFKSFYVGQNPRPIDGGRIRIC